MDSHHINLMNPFKELQIAYLNKSEEIKKRLGEFQIFFHEQYSWFYSENKLTLKPVKTGHNQRLFEELCFCILTANTSAEMSAKAIDSIRDILMTGTASEITNRLKGVYRFINKRAYYIAYTREYLKKEVNLELRNICNNKQGNELRDFFALNKNIKGIGMKEASHFLRNIGFFGFAILDKHIINSLYEFNILNTNKKPKNREEYLAIEERFNKFAKKTGIDIDELDLLLWSRKNGTILK